MSSGALANDKVRTPAPEAPAAEAAAPELTWSVVTSFASAAPLAAEWDALITRTDGRLYQTYDWCRIWWNHYGTGRDLQILTFRAGGELVGVLPMFVERLGPGLLGIKVAKLVSSDFTMVICDPAVEPRWAEPAFRIAIEYLVKAKRCDAVHFGPISAAHEPLAGLREACVNSAQTAVVARDQTCGMHTEFQFPDGFEAYLAGLAKRQRGNYRNNANLLNKSFRVELDTLRGGDELASEFEHFMELHQVQWQEVNKLGHFGDWPGAADYHRELVRELARSGRVRLLRLVLDGEPAAYNFCLALGDVYYWRLPARKIGPEWDRYALGRVSLLKMLEAAAADGAHRVEAGSGKYDYKEKLNAATHSLHSIVIAANHRGARLRSRLALWTADAIHKLYYKHWFLRVAPRLPWPRRPLHPAWIRRRFS